jgi:hypothetical protein
MPDDTHPGRSLHRLHDFKFEISNLTSPTKVPNGNLGQTGKMREISYKSLYLKALWLRDRHFTHLLRPMNMDGRSILSVTSIIHSQFADSERLFTQLFSRFMQLNGKIRKLGRVVQALAAPFNHDSKITT